MVVSQTETMLSLILTSLIFHVKSRRTTVTLQLRLTFIRLTLDTAGLQSVLLRSVWSVLWLGRCQWSGVSVVFAVSAAGAVDQSWSVRVVAICAGGCGQCCCCCCCCGQTVMTTNVQHWCPKKHRPKNQRHILLFSYNKGNSEQRRKCCSEILDTHTYADTHSESRRARE